MLLRFKIRNYKSYREMQDFTMIGGSTKSYDERLRKEKNYSVLKFSAIYGANGAGKSNIIEALLYMQNIVLDGLPKYIAPISFKLNEQEKKSETYFETILLLGSKVYSYGFEYNSKCNKLTSEWLCEINGKKETYIYSRNIVDGSYDIDIKNNSTVLDKMKFYLDDLRKDESKLFISFINSNKKSEVLGEIKELQLVYNWFESDLRIVSPEYPLTSGEYYLNDDKIRKLAQLLEEFDTGIKSIGKIDVDVETAQHSIPARVLDRIKADAYSKRDKDKPIKYGVLVRGNNNVWNVMIANDKMSFQKIVFYHDKDKQEPFYLGDESSGTIRILDLAEVLLTDRDNQLFVIDELDRKLHPQLTCKFVKMFLEKAKNTNNQLIVTTHESRLLDFNILRRDEIWFSDKDLLGESKIYSLEEFNVRFDKKIDKAYLDGRYGGVPVFDTVFPSFE